MYAYSTHSVSYMPACVVKIVFGLILVFIIVIITAAASLGIGIYYYNIIIYMHSYIIILLLYVIHDGRAGTNIKKKYE